MAEIVISAFVQEIVSRAVSFVLDKREEKASESHSLERLEMALSELQFSLERTANLPITDISLLQRRKVLKLAYINGTDLLDKHRRQALQKDQDIRQGIKRKRLWIPPAKNLVTSSFSSLNRDDVRRFEWFADCAGKFVRDVESGCSLRHYTFCNPLVRHLLEGKTLTYQMVQGNWLQDLYIWPTDHTAAEKDFLILLILRLSESTDIIGIAVKYLQFLTSQFKVVYESAIGELTLLANLQDISRSYAPPLLCCSLIPGADWARPERHIKETQLYRLDPVCCKAKEEGPCANNIVLSEMSQIFREQVIYSRTDCYSYISALEHSLPSSSDEVGTGVMRDWRPPLLKVSVCIAPHLVDEKLQPQESYAMELDGDNEEFCHAINYFLHQPEMTDYNMLWASNHGFGRFVVQKPSTETARGGCPREVGGVSIKELGDLELVCHFDKVMNFFLEHAGE
ncbi:hypothetical protein PVAP13_2KG028664 [Panicum virgatum]|uniref:Uncharacterized protein n=1 Tax=Panicum virgatum TaxID=38727 RepID=A0A8T0W4V1_PANVG|nr:hypothetical protein PVAP13_2KG028664 [Panicum virgatum]